MFDLTILAFNTAECLRTPVFLLADAAVGHMREAVVIPEPGQLSLVRRRLPEPGADPYTLQGFLDLSVAPMPIFGRGFKAHVTGSCHDGYGMRNVVDATALDHFVRTLSGKISKQRDSLIHLESEATDQAALILVGYGIVGRAGLAIARQARASGLAVGCVRPLTVWPFADAELRALCGRAQHVLVLENNLGQMFPYVQAALADGPRVHPLPPPVLGTLHHPDYVIEHIREVLA